MDKSKLNWGRTRMSWDWVGKYPVFVYTRFIDHFKFNVRIVIGKKGNQNAEGFGPSAKADIEYVQRGLASKREVDELAFEKARIFLNLPPEEIEVWDGIVPEICLHCGAQAKTQDQIKHYTTCDPTAVYEYNIEEEE